MSNLVSIITVPVGARIQYEFPGEHGIVQIVGTRGDAVGEDSSESIALMSMLGNRSFWITTDAGESIPVSRYARVTVL